jgi:hypothetical protein
VAIGVSNSASAIDTATTNVAANVYFRSTGIGIEALGASPAYDVPTLLEKALVLTVL